MNYPDTESGGLLLFILLMGIFFIGASVAQFHKWICIKRAKKNLLTTGSTHNHGTNTVRLIK